MKTATSIEESKKLLSLGIDPETADMSHCCDLSKPYKCAIAYKDLMPHIKTKAVPAWSLSGLLDRVIPKFIKVIREDREYRTDLTISCERGCIWRLSYFCNAIPACVSSDLFTACIELIEELVKQGYIKTKKVCQ